MAKKHPDHVNLERWLVSYADFITLLFAFFVIMYAISRSDIQKFKQVSESLRAAFSADFIDQTGTSGGKSLNQFEQQLPTGGLLIDMPAGKTNIRSYENEELKRLADIMEESLSFELGPLDAAEKLQITYDDRGLVVRLSAKGFYDSGRADVRREALGVLNQIAKTLATTKRNIRVEGHTDNGKTASEYFPSNWELSTARASWIVRYFIQKFKFDPTLLSAAGLAEFHPIDTNDTDTGRDRNRRVEILVLGK